MREGEQTGENAPYSDAGAPADGLLPPEALNASTEKPGRQSSILSRVPAPHFHVWLRRGRTYTMVARSYEARATAAKAATKLRADKADRLVLQCESCPPAVRSKRKPIRWPRVAAALGVDADALRSAIESERRR